MGADQETLKPFFVRWGRRGGQTRARRLSAVRRRAIASRAARARWKSERPAGLTSVRLTTARWDDPVALYEILSEGRLSEWEELFRIVEDRPFGSTASALERVLAAEPLYGATTLWRGILRGLRSGAL